MQQKLSERKLRRIIMNVEQLMTKEAGCMDAFAKMFNSEVILKAPLKR